MKTPEDLLRAGLAELHLTHTEAQIQAFLLYLEELKKWNRAYNLTAIKKDADIIIKHFLDSLLYLAVLPNATTSLADVGSGAGFPGIPIKIMRPELAVCLIEPTQKKALFLQHICSRLHLTNTSVLQLNIEKITDLQVDVAVTRALFSTAEFIAKARHIVRGNGCVILSKGPKVHEELQGIPDDRISMRTVQLPFSTAERHLVVAQIQ